MKARVGLYNMHMPAMGGGEKRTLVLAQHLSSKHDVFLFVGEPIAVPRLEGYFNVDLSRVKVVKVGKVRPMFGWLPAAFPVLPLFHHYSHFRAIRSLNLDVFINNSNGSELPCPAPAGIYMCMFPHPRTRGF